MDIKPIDQTVKNLLETSFYKIPRFQRPYSWDRENVEDFWNDAVASDDPDYFIGSFVLYRSKGSTDLLLVVDGQQRLATTTLLLAAVRDALHDLSFPELAQGIQKLIERPDINNQMQFVLQSETPYPYLQEHIQKYGEAELPASFGAEEEALKSAYEFLKGQIRQALSAIESDTTISTKRKRSTKQDKLVTIRDKLLRLQLISVQLDNEDDAYLIFETLNTRGKDLTVSDLVKNHLTRLLKPTNKGVDVAKDKWNSILELFDNSAANIDVNRFLHHGWLSRHPYITEKKLFKEIKRTVGKSSAMAFLDDLVADAHLYRRILEPEFYKWSKQVSQIASSIRALNLFRVVQPVPMLLSIIRDYTTNGLSARQTKSVLRTMENFHVQFTAVTSQRTGGGTALMYASAARQLLDATDKNEKAQVLKEFVSKLKERVPSYEEFEAGFREIYFTEESTKQRPLVRYILTRIDDNLRGGGVVNYDGMTIEHIAPQNPHEKNKISLDAIGMIGNMILVPENLNEKLANKPFETKKNELIKADVPLDGVLKDASEWTDDEIINRTRWLAKHCYDAIFKL